jgi:hypothetical protein
MEEYDEKWNTLFSPNPPWSQALLAASLLLSSISYSNPKLKKRGGGR